MCLLPCSTEIIKVFVCLTPLPPKKHTTSKYQRIQLWLCMKSCLDFRLHFSYFIVNLTFFFCCTFWLKVCDIMHFFYSKCNRVVEILYFLFECLKKMRGFSNNMHQINSTNLSHTYSTFDKTVQDLKYRPPQLPAPANLSAVQNLTTIRQLGKFQGQNFM